jgi:hypothetical protein
MMTLDDIIALRRKIKADQPVSETELREAIEYFRAARGVRAAKETKPKGKAKKVTPAESDKTLAELFGL